MEHERPLLVKDGITGEKWLVNLACNSDFHVNHRVLLQAASLQHGTDGFTSPPKEGMVWIFPPKNLTASDEIKPAILSTRGQHANHQTTKAAKQTVKMCLGVSLFSLIMYTTYYVSSAAGKIGRIIK
jgi:hypothetical protein